MIAVKTKRWPPRCPKCGEQLALVSATADDGNPTLKGFYCRTCKDQFTWRTLATDNR